MYLWFQHVVRNSVQSAFSVQNVVIEQHGPEEGEACFFRVSKLRSYSLSLLTSMRRKEEKRGGRGSLCTKNIKLIRRSVAQ